MKKEYWLVYQAGIANVFVVGEVTARRKQAGFRACEEYCRGLIEAGETVKVAWCNEAGDIIKSIWNVKKFYNAPFSEAFAKDFVPDEE